MFLSIKIKIHLLKTRFKEKKVSNIITFNKCKVLFPFKCLKGLLYCNYKA